MGFRSIDIGGAVIFALLAFVYVGWTYRSGSAEDYHTANRKAGPFRTIASVFTVVGAPHYAIFTGLAFVFGWLAIAFYAGALLGLTILSQFSSKIRSYGAEGAHTFTDIAYIQIGRVPAFALSLLGIMFTIGVVVAQLIVGAQMLEIISGLYYEWGIFLLALTTAAYLIPGGYRALINTDIIQGLIMLVFSVVLVAYLFVALGAEVPAITSSSGYGQGPAIPFIPFLFLGGVLVVLGSPEIWQRILTSRSDRVAKAGLVIAGLTMFFWGALVVAVGMAIHALAPELPPQEAFSQFVGARLPEWLIGVVGVLLIAAILSTTDTEVFATAVIAYREYQRSQVIRDAGLRTWKTRVLISVICLIAWLAALALTNIMVLWNILLNLGYVMGPLALAIAMGRGGPSRPTKLITFLVGLIGSLSVFAYIVYTTNDFFSYATFALVAVACVPLLTSRPKGSG